MSARRPQSLGGASSADAVHTDALSIDEIIERYRGEWILMRVTEHDEDGWPVRGYVTVHAATQEAMLDEMERQTESPEHARLPRYSFLADPGIYINDPAEFQQLITELIEADRADRV